ncbi:MAG: NADH-quinone oxidoreductase subunit J [Proteobacteria bacterium]|nr:MAG: NADH-quinone oxidoreductase subunit J [Pseudomonadota bacterium]
MTADTFLFWLLAIVTVISGLGVILVANPVYSALCLAMTMVGVSALFASLGAYFIAGVQMIVYAGAVLVLFTMVLMLFDLRTEIATFTRGKFTGAVKVAIVGLLAGFLAALYQLPDMIDKTQTKVITGDTTKSLGTLLFTKYVFGFEALGILLLIIAIGVVGLSRSKGGTHAKH